MKILLLLFLLLSLSHLHAQNDSFFKTRLGAETRIDIPLKENEKLTLQSFYNEQPVWVRIVRDTGLAQVAVIGVKVTSVCLDRFIAIYPKRLTRIQLDVFTTALDSDVVIDAQRHTWQRLRHPLSYRVIFYTALTVWVMLFLWFMTWRIKRYYQCIKHRYTDTDTEKTTLFEQVSLLLERIESQQSLPVADAATLYLLILSCWNLRYNWGGRQRLIQLYPFIAQDPTLKPLHAELESYLFSTGKTLNTHALLESCKPTEQGENQ